MPLPNLIIIGAMKCGTTSLHQYLSHHSDVFMSETKELDFFIESRNFKKGVEWYKQQFSDGFLVNGEASQNYTKREIDDQVAKRIFDMIPDAKLIYMVRDPIARIQSHFKDLKTYGYVEPNRDINDVVNEDPKFSMFMTSYYYYQIKPYLDHFSRDQILFVQLESLNKSTLEVMNGVFRFLGISEWKSLPFGGDDKLNASSSKTVERPMMKSLRDSGTIEAVKKLIPLGLFRGLRDIIHPLVSTSLEMKTNQLSPDSIKILKETMQDDLEKFKEVSGINYC
ncbi:MAG: sulfotransferase [Cyclobacteriaceae bacterium]|nr:sulfotransferase [Cyclobacteriaceae bacterium SS2]